MNGPRMGNTVLDDVLRHLHPMHKMHRRAVEAQRNEKNRPKQGGTAKAEEEKKEFLEDKVRNVEARARALGARERRDAAHVLLQNVEYEVQHYERQIRARKRFRSKFSEEEVGVAGEEGSSADVLERLKRELSERRRLKTRVEALGEEKDALRGKVTEELDTLKSWEKDFRALAGGAALLREAVKEAPPASPSLGEGKLSGGKGTGEGAQGGDGTS